MRALTLWQPWATWIMNGWKTIENRPWKPPNWITGHLIAIHAGKKFDPRPFDVAKGLRLIPEDTPELKEDYPLGELLGMILVKGWVSQSDDPWFTGPYAWTLGKPHKLISPIGCRGHQKLWNVPIHLVGHFALSGWPNREEILNELRADVPNP